MASLRAQQVARELIQRVKKGEKVNLQEIQKKFGYSDTSAASMKVKTTKSFHDVLNKAGLSDDLLAKKHGELINARRLCEYEFKGKRTAEKREKTNKDGSVEEETVTAYEPIPDIVIQKMIESVPGCILLHIDEYGWEGGKRAFYSAPDGVAQDKALEKAYKIKGHFTADKQNPDDAPDALPSDEQKRLRALLGFK